MTRMNERQKTQLAVLFVQITPAGHILHTQDIQTTKRDQKDDM